MSDSTHNGALADEVATAHVVTLEVPARPEYLYLIRLIASGWASRLDFSYDEVEDLRLAIDELCLSLIGSEGRAGTVRLRYRGGADGLVVDGVAQFSAGGGGVPSQSGYSRQILAALVDSYELSQDAPGGHRFRLAKRPTRAEQDRGQ